jgi:hypothetical protein
MHPFLFMADHRVGHVDLPPEERRLARRSQPEHLRLMLQGPGASFVNVYPLSVPVPVTPGLVARLWASCGPCGWKRPPFLTRGQSDTFVQDTCTG